MLYLKVPVYRHFLLLIAYILLTYKITQIIISNHRTIQEYTIMLNHTYTRKQRTFSDMRIKVLRCLAIKHRWCRPAEVVRLVQQAKGDTDYSYVRDRQVYSHLHALAELGLAKERTSGGGDVFKRYEVCITDAGLDYINQIDPIQPDEYENTEMPSESGRPTTADYSFIHYNMTAEMIDALRYFENGEQGVWYPPLYVAPAFQDRRQHRSLMLMADFGVVEQVEWSYTRKPMYRYRISQLGRDYLRYVDSLSE